MVLADVPGRQLSEKVRAFSHPVAHPQSLRDCELDIRSKKAEITSTVSGVRKRVVSKRVVLADDPSTPKTGTRAPETRHDGAKNRNEGTKNGMTVPKTGTRAHSPRPPFYTRNCPNQKLEALEPFHA